MYVPFPVTVIESSTTLLMYKTKHDDELKLDISTKIGALVKLAPPASICCPMETGKLPELVK